MSGNHSPQPLVSPDYATRLMRHLQSQIETVPRDRGESYEPVDLDDLVHPDCRWAWDEIGSRGKLHRFARHIRSSQTFAVNLFGGLPEASLKEILSAFFGPVSHAEKPMFEFEDALDRLRESVPYGQRTQVDVVLRGNTQTGRRVALLVEVKLSEVDFGNCSGATDELNDTPHLCGTSGAFGSDPQNCFKLRNHGAAERRTYDRYLAVADLSPGVRAEGCWFRTSAYQPMRNVALAGVLRQEDGIDTLVAVCAPLLHRSMWAHFDDARQVLPEGSVVPLPAEVVLALQPDSTYHFMRDRYSVDHGVEVDERQLLEAATWQIVGEFDALFRHGFRLFGARHGGGGPDCITLADLRDGQFRTCVELNRDGHINVLADARHVPLEDGWRRALQGDSRGVAAEIGARLGLPARVQPSESMWTAFERTIRMGWRAGETLVWQNHTNEESGLLQSTHFLGDWSLVRQGSNHAIAAGPGRVFSGRASSSA